MVVRQDVMGRGAHRAMRVAVWLALPALVLVAAMAWWWAITRGGAPAAPPAGPARPATAPATQTGLDEPPQTLEPGEPTMSDHSTPTHTTNRLANERSPYLLQHAHNPVDWYPWGEEAFERARREDKPIFLSVGYSTCHWCHVMAHESFEDPRVARLLNEHYVAIKVDREERPDIDEIYMHVTQMVTGRGGWPNSVFLTPDGRPWFAGTYFPPEDRPGQPGFPRVLRQLAEAWRTRRDEVERQADQLTAALRNVAQGPDAPTEPPGSEPGRAVVEHALRALRDAYDERYGGFGAPPKFPPHTALALLLHEYGRSRDLAQLEMLTGTLDAMARGGIRDHVGGGFHRYSTDVRWFLPHFEKMLYDNAQLALAYARAYALTGEARYARVARETFDFLLRDLAGPEGAFHCAYDADSEGVEGKFYLWSRAEILAVLGEEEGGFFGRIYGVEEDGNYAEEHTGRRTAENLLHLPRSLEQVAAEERLDVDALYERLRLDRERLRERRAQRPWPHRDDKVLTSWNALAIEALALGGAALQEPRYVDAARRAARFLLQELRVDGRLRPAWRGDAGDLNAYLDDYAFLAAAMLALYEVEGRQEDLEEAQALVETMLEHYHDDRAGGFHFTPDDHEDLLVRTRSPFDHAMPSGNAVAARVLVDLGRLTGQPRYFDLARGSFRAFSMHMQRAPEGTEGLILALSMYLDAAVTAEGEAGDASSTPAPTRERPDVRSRVEPVTVEVYASQLTVAPGARVRVALRLAIDQGYHVNAAEPGVEQVVPTSLAVQDGGVVRGGTPAYPVGRPLTLPTMPEPLQVYEGETWLLVPLQVVDDAAPGRHEVTLRLRFQACDDQRCLAPQDLPLRLTLHVDPAAHEAPRHEAIFEAIR